MYMVLKWLKLCISKVIFTKDQKCFKIIVLITRVTYKVLKWLKLCALMVYEYDGLEKVKFI